MCVEKTAEYYVQGDSGMDHFWSTRCTKKEVRPLRALALFRLSQMPPHLLEGQSATVAMETQQMQFARLIAASDNEAMAEAAQYKSNTWYQ